jgi:hypothetical protein
MSPLLLATEGGQVVAFDPASGQHRSVFHSSDDEAMMGIAIAGPHLYVASLSRLYKLRLADFSLVTSTLLYDPTPDFHQMQCYDGLLYVTATKTNQIWIFDEDLTLTRVHQVPPPDPKKPVKYKKNYNHLNNIIREDDRFYIGLNWLTTTQYASSGVLVTDADLMEIERLEFGWETHDFQFLDGKKIAICATSSKGKRVRHPYRSGLMVEGELRFEHDAEEAFCKGLCHDDDYIYLCGGRKMERRHRRNSSSIIYILNRADYSLARTFESGEIKAIKGAIRHHYPA